MSKGSKHSYPFRPSYPRPKKPSKGLNKPSSDHIHGKRKTWMSDSSVIQANMDMSPRSGMPWWKSPMYKQRRAAKLAQLRG